MTDEPMPALEYDRTPPGYVSRRRHRMMLAIPWAVLAGVALLMVLPTALRAWRMSQQRQALAAAPAVTFTVATPVPTATATPAWSASVDVLEHYRMALPPAGTVVYEEEPVAASKLLASGGTYKKPSMGNTIAPYGQAFQPPAMHFLPYPSAQESELRTEDDACRLFAHELTSAGGNQRLVLLDLKVEVAGRQETAKDPYMLRLYRRLFYRVLAVDSAGGLRTMREGPSLKVLTPGGDQFPVRWTDGVMKPDRPAGAHLRFLAGRPDAMDPSHFAVPFASPSVQGRIDVWLGDDDFVRIVPSVGTVVEGDWFVTGKPADGPEGK